jgi:hypothetical protein
MGLAQSNSCVKMNGKTKSKGHRHMSDTTLYDKQTAKPATIDRGDITPADIQQFCDSNGLSFHGMGCPEGCGGTGWNDPTVFRAATHDVPARGVTIALDTVLQWKHAIASMGIPVSAGGLYQHYQGYQYTTVCEAMHAATGKRQIVYKDDAGKILTLPWDDFFGIVKVEGRIVARVLPVGHSRGASL